MGHQRLGRLPRTHKWKQVVALLQEGADLSEIAQASFEASLNGLKKIADDPGFTSILANIFDFVQAARSGDFTAELRKSGLDVETGATALDVVASLREKLDRVLASEGIKSDAGEIAQNAFTDTLLRSAAAGQSSLFETTSDHLREALSSEMKGNRFAGLMHEFYTSFTHRYLTYYLSRELSNHVGGDRYFGSSGEHQDFNQAFNLYIRQTVRIADEFTPGWLGKAIYRGEMNRQAVSKYAHVAFNKIAGEFRRGAEALA